MKKFILLLMLLIFIACSKIKSGTVIHKEFVPAHSKTSTHYNAALKMMQTTTRNVPNKWFVTIRGKNSDGEYEIATHQVHKQDYEIANFGKEMNFE